MENQDFSIVIPCYNEEKNIKLLVNAFLKEINNQTELILVNNGSTDKTEEILKKLEKKHNFLKIIKIRKNIGYGHGIFSGLKNAKGKFIAWTHADLQASPKDVLTGFQIIKKTKDPKKTFVKGKRSNRNFFDSFFAFGMGIFCSIILGKWLTDINAQPNIFHKSLLDKMTNPPTDFSFDLYALFLAKKNKFRIERFPVEFPKRMHGKSSWNTGIKAKIKMIKIIIRYTLKLRGKIND